MDNTLNKSVSASEINVLSRDDRTPINNVSFRNKRAWEPDFRTELDDFKQEMRHMITSLFASQAEELRKITSSQKEIQRTSQSIENSVAFLAAQNEEFKKKIESLELKIKQDKEHMTILEDRIEELQRGCRKSNIEIKNVPKQSNETRSDLIEMVVCLSRNIGCTIDKSDIKDIYRARGKKEKSNNPPIVVETSSTILKMDLLKMCKSFNVKHKSKLCAKHLGFRTSEDTPIFISEQLTAKASRLFFLSRDLAKQKSYKFCWTAFGKVYLRKDEISPIILMNNETQVQQLLNK